MRIAVDTGGTFTDCVLLERGQVRALKVFSTSENLSRGIAEGIAGSLPRAGVKSLDVIHGTTIGTNSLLERRGARVALVTTAGFEDVIEIGRQDRPLLYDFNVQRDPPLVGRGLRFGVRERVASDGKILLRPSAKDLSRLRRKIARSRAESIAICFLFSFANPENEIRAAQALRSLKLPISVSHRILPEFREYERVSTVGINAYLAPLMGRYLRNLICRVGTLRLQHSRVFVMQSSGGITTAERAAHEPVRTILSGPAGGVVAATWVARRSGIENALSFDMGGTSTDVCLISGDPRTTRETTLGGLPVAVPVLDVHSVGAGGGSLVRIDAGGALRVGPESAGSTPGPACYARGGKQPTVTDAHVILGRLQAGHFLGGAYSLDSRAAHVSFTKFIKSPSCKFSSVTDLARGTISVANANMERALRVISAERGHDPRDFWLVSFGGAGGLHAADLARNMGLKGVIVPENPGAFSAVGILVSDIVKDISQTILRPVPIEQDPHPEFKKFIRQLMRNLTKLETRAKSELRRDVSGKVVRTERHLDLRYLGQAYELTVPFTPDFPARFRREHERVYGYDHPGRSMEVVNLRVRLSLPTVKPRPRKSTKRTRQAVTAAVADVCPVWFDRQVWETPFYCREKLQTGMRIQGPAVITEYSSTTVVPPDFVCQLNAQGSLVLSGI